MDKYENAKDTVKVGTVLWEMRGRRRNDTVEWYAVPKCVEYTDKHKFLFGDKTGGSWGNIGKNTFLTREDALAHFLETHDSLTEKIGIDDDTPGGAYELPRTDWQDYEITLFDGVTQSSVYCNGFGNLINVTDGLEWRQEWYEGFGVIQKLTLSEIAQQLAAENGGCLITVFENDPGHCEIFQCNNYEKGRWVRLGKIQGYA